MANKVTLTKDWQVISDGSKAIAVLPGRNGFGMSDCEITLETAAPAASVEGIGMGVGINLPATAEKVYARGSGTIKILSYTPK
jgi:hypothetical protein